MFRLTAKSRIVIGQMCLLITVLMISMFMAFIPDQRQAVLVGRETLCEAITVNSSIMVGNNDIKRLRTVLGIIVNRKPDMLSAAVRRNDGHVVAEVGNHVALWQPLNGNRSTDSQVYVPIRAGNEKWGGVEVRFQPLTQFGWLALLTSPWTRFIAFATTLSFLLNLVYFGKMLQHLDPSNAVPGRVRSALDTLAEGLLVIDPSGRIVLANESFSRIVEKTHDQLIGVPAADLPWKINTEIDAPEYPWVVAIESQTQLNNVILEMQCDGQTLTFVVNCSPVLGQDGKYRGVLASFEDVTALEKTKSDLQQSKEEADDANNAKSEFLARMSHEIRTPMNAILGYTDVLRRGFDDDDMISRNQYLNTIHSSGTHLLDLINDILDLSKIESGKLEIELTDVSPLRIMSEVASVLRGKADEKEIAINVATTGKVPAIIQSDPTRLRQILTNLAANAIKFTESGGVTINARFIDSRKKPQMAFDVIDTGIGIPDDAIQTIFEPFSQADSSVTRRFGGTGLGLAICRRFADALGGSVSVTSEAGKGSTFTVTIDAGRLAEDVRMVDFHSGEDFTQSANANVSADIKLSATRILVVDDGATNRNLLSLVLGRAGAEVVQAENGQIAVELVNSENFDIVLMDMQMPVMDGYAAATMLRKQGHTLPIFALTAHAMAGDEEKCLAAGCSGFCTKPIDIDKLLKQIAEALGVDTTADTTAHDTADDTEASSTATVASGSPETPTAATPEPPSAVESVLERASCASNNRQAAAPNATLPKIQSTFPMDDEDFREIVIEFIQHLHQKLDAMLDSWERRDLEELAKLAHWLKGSGGTAGFPAFTEPALALETLAKAEDVDRIPAAIAQLVEISDRLDDPEQDAQIQDAQIQDAPDHDITDQDATDRVLNDHTAPELQPQPESSAIDFLTKPNSTSESHPVHRLTADELPALMSTLPRNDQDFMDVVRDFVHRLEEKLQDIRWASAESDLAEVARLARWIKAASATAGFNVFARPARKLEEAAKLAHSEEIESTIQEFEALADRISDRHKSAARS